MLKEIEIGPDYQNKNRDMTNKNSTDRDCACEHQNSDIDVQRRRVFNIVGTSLISSLPWTCSEVAAQSVAILLVDANAESDFKPLRPSDLALTKPLLAFPFDSKTGTPKNESRLSKIVLVRLPEDQMTPETRARSAAGVVAYSSICTHQGCDVKTWMSKESVLACYCHNSKYNLFDGAKVVGGPAPKPLPAIPLMLEGEFLAIVVPLRS